MTPDGKTPEVQVAPIHLQFALAVYTAPDYVGALGKDYFYSPAGSAVTEWLLAQGLVELDNGTYKITQKGVAWIAMLCATPMPEQRWLDPRTQRPINR